MEDQAAQWLSDRGWTDSVTRIGPATTKYNCHSYAWYRSEGGSNDYWIQAFLNSDLSSFNPYSYSSTPPAPDNINKYWNDYSFIEANSEDEAIKIWYGSCWVWNGDEWTNNCDHSAIRIPSGLYESKWGAWPLYRHPSDKCPYSLNNIMYLKSGPYVAGPTLICSIGTEYTLEDFPINDRIFWLAGPYLTVSSGQGT